MRIRPLVLGGAAAAVVVLAAAGSASAATASHSYVTASQLTVSPASLTFAPQQVRTESAIQTVTITNTTNESAYLGQVNDGDSNFDFVIGDATTCGNTTLAPGASCTVAVAFAPLSAGTLSNVVSVTVGAYPDLTVVAIPVTGVGLG
jgi:trimeric autotransporter adhesin